MSEPTDPLEQTLASLRELLAIAQSGLTFAKDPFDIERYTRMRELVTQMLASNPPLVPGREWHDDLMRLFSADTGYATPKIEVRGAAFRDGRILMVRERADGLWTLPGGWADVNQSPSAAVVKEIREESGFEARALRLAAVLDRRLHGHPPSIYHAYKLFFLCELTGGSPTVSTETDGVEFFAEDALPPLSVQRVTAAQIGAMFRHARTENLATDFD